MNLIVIWKENDSVYLNFYPGDSASRFTWIDCKSHHSGRHKLSWERYVNTTKDPNCLCAIPTTATTSAEVRAEFPELFI